MPSKRAVEERNPIRVEQPLANHAAIALRAYELFVGRGAQHGHDLDDWLEAERQLARLAVEKPWRS